MRLTRGDVKVTFTLRRALPSDARAIAEVQVQSWRETYPGIIPADVIDSMNVEERTTAWAQNLLEGPPFFRFTYVAETAEKGIVGFGSGGPLRQGQGPFFDVPADIAAKYQGELQAIYLLRAHQRVGIGRALFGAVTEELRRLGHQSMLVRVLKDNPTRGYYENMGGKLVGEKKIKLGIWLDEWIYGWDVLTVV